MRRANSLWHEFIHSPAGEKIVPLPQESHIGTSSLLLGCLMFGRGREQAGLLIEPAKEYAFDPIDETFLVQFRNKLWQVVVM